MVNVLSFLAKYLPFWALPLIWITVEVGKYYYNQRDRMRTFLALSIVFFCVISLILWVVFGGYSNGSAWVRSIFIP